MVSSLFPHTQFYLNHKVNKGLGLIKKLIQYILLLLAIYTGFTRISDYKRKCRRSALVAIFVCQFSETFRKIYESQIVIANCY